MAVGLLGVIVYLLKIQSVCNLIGILFLIIINCRCARNAATTSWTSLQPTAIPADVFTSTNATALWTSSTYGSGSSPVASTNGKLWHSAAAILPSASSYDATGAVRRESRLSSAGRESRLSSTAECVTDACAIIEGAFAIAL